MLESYFVKPQTVDRIGACWIGAEIERYARWLSEHGYSTRTVRRRIPAVVAFAEFARRRGACEPADLPAHVDGFVAAWVAGHRGAGHAGVTACHVTREVRGAVEQMLVVVLPGFERAGRPRRELAFARAVPGFFDYLAAERGLCPESIVGYRYHLACFEAYLDRIGVAGLAELSPAILSAFVAERSGAGLARTTVRTGCGVLRVFLRYAHRQGLVAADLSKAVEWPTAYQLAGIPRSISRAEVARVLGAVDRRTPCGKRDYAILLLLVTYGLRAREVASLMLDHIDWRRDRLAIPGRKAGHSTAFPLSAVVGEALVDYLRHGRPPSTDRHVFFRAKAPAGPLTRVAVSACARHHLLKAGIVVPRAGSHTLRHACIQRLVDAGFGFKAIGDFVGHRSPASTAIYAKVAIEPLRQVALGDGEQVLT
jgi:integrase/recombinase XerD